MPPKRNRNQRKVDPETQARQFEEWKESEEYKQWGELLKIKADHPEDYSQTTDDLFNDMEFVGVTWQEYLNALYDFGKITMKMKAGKLKSFLHEHFRSFTFVREDKKDFEKDGHHVPYIDGVNCGSNKEYFDEAWHIRKKLEEIHKYLDEYPDLTDQNYMASRKRLQKEMSELCKMILNYQKKYHKEVYENQLAKAIEPLSNFLKSNTRLCLFEETYPTPAERYKAEFKEQALEEAFCNDMQNCLRILYEVEKDPQSKIVANPNVKKIFFKLKYKDWDKNPIERFYLKPLKYNFIKMRTNLFKLHSYGIDYWRIPLAKNQVFLRDVKKVINAELISENLLADYLWKDQLNFIYQVIGIIIKSPGVDKVKKKDETMLNISIPELVVFKTLQEMRRILDKKIEDSRDIAAEDPTSYTAFIKNSDQQVLDTSQLQQSQLQTSMLAQSTLKNTNQLQKPQQSMDGGKSPLKSKKTMVQILSEEEEEKKKKEEAELKKYGRFWLWENYVEESDRELFEKGAELLLKIHEAIQQDIQDFIITEGLVPKYKDQASKIQNKGFNQIKKDKDRLHELRLEANNQMEINNIRPPLLWNHPDILETEERKHEFRANSMPKTCYIDGRVIELLDLVIELARKLQSYKAAVWNELITRVIDCYNDEYNPQPTFCLHLKTVVVSNTAEEEKTEA